MSKHRSFPVGARKGDEQVGRTLFLTNVKLHGLEDRWFMGLTKITYQLFFSVFRDIFRSGRISSVYIVSKLWVVGHTFSKLVNFECC